MVCVTGFWTTIVLVAVDAEVLVAVDVTVVVAVGPVT